MGVANSRHGRYLAHDDVAWPTFDVGEISTPLSVRAIGRRPKRPLGTTQDEPKRQPIHYTQPTLL